MYPFLRFDFDDFKFGFQIIKNVYVRDLNSKESISGLDFINNSECDDDILIYWGQKA